MTITAQRSAKDRAAEYMRWSRAATLAEPTTYSHLQSGGVFDANLAVMREDDWCVYLDSGLDRWAVFTDAENKRVFIGPTTWVTMSFSHRARQQFETEFLPQSEDDKGVSGMKFIVADVGPYAEAARAEARAAGTDVPAVKDRLTALIEQANHFVMQAASINQRPTSGQTQMFAVRYAALGQTLADLKRELAHAESLVQLAGAALSDATSA